MFVILSLHFIQLKWSAHTVVMSIEYTIINFSAIDCGHLINDQAMDILDKLSITL